MNTQLFIPKKCKAGFNLRSDTYSGKLAYVIAFDGKKWRKENSWESWRQKEGEKKERYYDYQKREYIEKGDVYGEEVRVLEFDNVPTSGFVLNKKVGGEKSHWDTRQTYARVFDPRGFEFEINIVNLLYILESSNCMKGKGLEGEFVYSWDGKDLVLLPCSSWEFEKGTNFTKLQSEKVSARNLVPGASYKTKREETIVYVGKFEWYQWKGWYYKEGERKCKKSFIFTSDNGKTFEPKSGIAFLAEQVSDGPVENYAGIIEKFQKTPNSSKIVKWEVEKVIPNLELSAKIDYYGAKLKKTGLYFKLDGDILSAVSIDPQHQYDQTVLKYVFKGFRVQITPRLNVTTQTFIEEVRERQSYWPNHPKENNFETEDEVKQREMGNLFITLENGRRFKLDDFNNL